MSMRRPANYIRDLIRQDMQDRAVALNILEGLGDLRHGRFSDKSILHVKDEDGDRRELIEIRGKIERGEIRSPLRSAPQPRRKK